MSAETTLALVERPIPGCAVVTLNRPAAMNALSTALRRELTAVFESLRTDGTRVVVLTGAGRAFCAGVDLRELAALTDPGQRAATGELGTPVQTIASFPGPVIAAINGPAVTGGFELALACDVLVASDRATFADTHARVGVLPAWGMSQKLPRLIGMHRAKEMSLTGNFIGAEQAEAWGLVNRVVPHERLLPDALQLAADMLSCVPQMLVACKQVMDEGALRPLGEGLELEVKRSRAWSAGLNRSALAEQTRAVQKRGRSQPIARGED